MQIRLLHLYPSYFPSVPIRCSLSKEFPGDAPPYQALSYVWADECGNSQILVDGHPFEVTRNLELALKRIRQSTATVTLWVDAICIDQSNLAERNEQVKLMAEVYSTTERVIVWLGEGADDSDLAIDLIKAWAALESSSFEVPLALPAIPIAFDRRAWLAARHLFTRSYWNRAWIFQEIAFSRHALVLCGNKEFSWKEIDRAQWFWIQLSLPITSPWSVMKTSG
jgi:hypothetical protein